MKNNLYRLGMVLTMSAGFAFAQSTAAPTTTPKTFPDQQSSSSADKSAQNPTSAQPQSSDQSSSSSSQLPSSSDQKSTLPDANSQSTPNSSSPSNSSSMPQSDQSSTAPSSSSTPSTSSSSSSSTDQSATSPSSSSSATQSSDQKSKEPSTGVQAGASSSASGLPQSDMGSDLQSKIQAALSQNNLSGVTVNASGDNVELNGTVSSKKERKEAMRIAKENANRKKVVDHIQVSSSANAGATTH